MNTVTQPGTYVNEYQQRAQATTARRRAAGRYARPTQAQEAAFKLSVLRDGRKSLTAAECDLLATHPYLAHSQRAEFAAMAAQRRTMDHRSAVLAAMLAADIAPYQLGALDCEKGESCNPEAIYDKDGDREEYREGWHAARAEIRGFRYQLLINGNYHDCYGYEDAIEQLVGFDRDMRASGYTAVAADRYERPNADGSGVSFHTIQLVDRLLPTFADMEATISAMFAVDYA